MSKLTKQNVDGVDYTVAGCALTGTCSSAASDFVKVVNLTDGDIVADGMSVAITFAQANTAGNAPAGQTVYSSDQVTYYSDAGLTNPVTLPPAGCYHVVYTGTGNAYILYTYPVITAGGVTAPLCKSDGSFTGGTLWSAGAIVVVLYTGGKFIISVSTVDAVQDGNLKAVTSNAVFDRLNVAFSAGLNLPAYESTVAGGEIHELGSYTIPETGVYAIDWSCYAVNNTNGGTSLGIKIDNYNVENLATNSFFQGVTAWSNCLECSCTRKLTNNC